MEPIVDVFIIHSEYDDNDWMLTIDVINGELSARCEIYEPYLCTPESWIALADGKYDRFNCYLGKGISQIVLLEGDIFMFESMPSGNCGELCCSFKIPRILVAEKLKSAIEKARNAGLKFREV